jgi:hypothetical protein
MSRLHKFKNYLTVSSFVQRAYKELEALNNEQYYLLQGEDIRKLVQEILPLTAFLKHFERPDRRIKCRYFSGNQNYDAKLKLEGADIDKGFFEAAYFVEVTKAEDEAHEHLRREALHLYGSVFEGKDIRKVGSKRKGTYKIESHAVAVDMDYDVKEAMELVKKVLEKKYAKRKPYPSPCLLLVQVETGRPLALTEWCTFVKEIQSAVNREKFRATYIIDWWTNTVLAI